MKKTYLQPEMEVISMKIQQMICESSHEMDMSSDTISDEENVW